jgi:hypothetical protein
MPQTPPKRSKFTEFDTPHRARFYGAFDHREKGVSLRQICLRKDINIHESTGRKWLRQRQNIGSPAYRRTRKLSRCLEALRRLSEALLNGLLDPSNPSHHLGYEGQVKALNLPVTAHTLQQNFATRRGAKRFKKLRTSNISDKNKSLRVQYSYEYDDKTITNHWQYVYFTDEVHFNSFELATKQEYDLRVPSSATRLAHIQESIKSYLNVTVHVAEDISYNHKSLFIFYNDPTEPGILRLCKPRKPRKSKYQTDEQYTQEVRDWEARQPHPVQIKPRGNSMTQKFYTENVLPHHIEHIHWLEREHAHQFYFQENNDPSHGTRSKNNVALQAKRAAGLVIIIHPAQSPDLNPIESIWQIIKGRLRGGNWRTVAEFKAAIQAEWERVTQEQIQKRIDEMPWRCARLVELKGARIRSTLW